MSDDQNNGGGNGNASTPPTPPPADAADAPAQPSHRDWNAFAKQQRETAGLLQQVLKRLPATIAAAPSAPAAPAEQSKAPASAAASNDQAMAEVRALRRELDVERALAAHSIADPEYRELITAAIQAKAPTDVGEFVAKYAAKLKPAAGTVATQQAQPAASQSVPVSPPPQVLVGTAGTSPGGTPARAQQPADILGMDAASWSALSNEDKRKAYERQVRKSSGNYNPFADAKVKTGK